MSFAIEAVELSKNYGPIQALCSLTFAVPQGEIVAFLGPNSAGKTTTLKILAGIMPGSRGSVTVAGYSAAYQSREVKRHVGYMPEHNPLPEDMTVEEYLCYRARYKELPHDCVRAQVQHVAELCNLSGKIVKRPIGVLSRGVRQRVGIADALLREPPILILDEPTIGLDPHQVLLLRDLIASMRGTRTVILSTHILSEAEIMADRVLIINKGQKVAFGTPAELKSAYAEECVWQLRTALPEQTLRLLAEGLGGKLEKREALRQDARYTVSLPNEAAAEALLKRVLEHPNAALTEFVRPSPSLENIFMEATSRKEEGEK